MMVDEPHKSPAQFQIADAMTINDLDTLKVVADPLRLSILEYLMKPGTVKRIAQKLDRPPTKLYYHFNQLEKHGLIQLVDTRVVSGIIEKHYQAAARAYVVARDLLIPGSAVGDEGLAITLSSVLTDTRNDVLDSINGGVISTDADAPKRARVTLGQKRLQLAPDQAEALLSDLQAVMSKYGALSKANEAAGLGQLFKALLVVHPTSRTVDDERSADA